MPNYLLKYKGIYRLKVPIDRSTNDFPKKLDGTNEDIDMYIDCKKGKIFNYGYGTLQAYVPKLGSGRNILKSIGKELNIDIDNYFCTRETKKGDIYKDKDGNPLKFYDYDSFYKKLQDQGIIFDVSETDEEVIWKFKAKDIELIARYLQSKTNGANISPFSTKNLFKDKNYKIPLEEITEYKKITDKIDKDNILYLSHLTKDFIVNIPKNFKQFKGKNINAIKKKSGLKGKEFIHSCGLWKDYIECLNNNINKL